MSKAQIIEREERWATPVAIATLLGAALVIATVFIDSAIIDTSSDASQLRTADEHATEFQLLAFLRAIGLAALSPSLFHLFRAAEARSEAVKHVLIGFAFIGPLLFALQGVLGAFALTDVAADFVVDPPAGEKAADTFAENLVEDSSFYATAQGLLFPALLGLVIGLIYIPLQAVRTGLLTRFMGTLGMALGVSMILIPFGILGVLLWFVYLGLVIGGWLPGGRPPAWAAGVAIPWLPPGEEVEEPAGSEADESTAGSAEVPVPQEPSQPRQRGERRKRKRRR